MQRKPNITRVNRVTTDAPTGRKKINWTKELVREAKERFPNESTSYLARSLGVSVEALKKYASRHGWRKSRKYLRTLGYK